MGPRVGRGTRQDDSVMTLGDNSFICREKSPCGLVSGVGDSLRQPDIGAGTRGDQREWGSLSLVCVGQAASQALRRHCDAVMSPQQ